VEGAELELVARARISAVYDIEVVPPYAYALERGLLHVLDVRDPTTVREIGALELPRTHARLWLHRRFLYLFGFGQALAAVDISDPVRPRWVAEWPEFTAPLGDLFEVSGSRAYLIKRTTETGSLVLEVLALTEDAARPRVLGKVDLGVRAQFNWGGGIAEQQGFVFFQVPQPNEDPSRDGVIVVDARDPARPRIERTLLLPAGRHFRDIEVRGDLLLLLQGQPAAGLAIFQMGTEDEPQLLGEVTHPELRHGIDLIVHGDVVYATFKLAIDLATFDISDPRHPKLAYTYKIPDVQAAGLGMTLVENRLYVAGDAGPSPILDVSEPQAPRLLGHWEYEGGFVGDLVREGPLTLVANLGTGIYVYDLSNPHKPRRLARHIVATSDEEWQWNVTLAAESSRALVAYESVPTELLDLSKPSTPVVLGRFTPRGLVHAAVLTRSYAVLGYREVAEGKRPSLYDSSAFSGRGGLEIIDFTRPGQPRSLAILPLDQAVTDIAVAGEHVLAAHPDGSLTVVEISTPAAPLAVGRFGGEKPVDGTLALRSARLAVSKDGRWAFVVHRGASAPGDPYRGLATLTVMDLQEPSRPRVASELPLDRQDVWEVSIAARGEQLVVFTGEIVLLDVSEPQRPRVELRQPFPYIGYDWVGLTIDDTHLYLGAGEDGAWIYRLPPPRRASRVVPVEVLRYE